MRRTISELALGHDRLLLALVVGLMAFGAYSYRDLPAQEDPKITIREAVITTAYPGLPAEQVEVLVTKTLELAVRSIPEIHEIRSVSLPGRSILHAEIRQGVPAARFDQVWDNVRSEIDAVRADLPAGTGPTIVDDDFGDVAVLTVALLWDEAFDAGERADMAQHVADMLFQVEGTKRVSLLGMQEERIFIEIENARLARLGLAPAELVRALQDQNIIRPGGTLDADGQQLAIQPTGNLETVEELGDLLISVPGRAETVELRDLARIRRGVEDPPRRTAYLDGQPAIVFAISKDDAVDVLDFTPAMERRLADVMETLPAGYSMRTITRQADVVARAVNGVSLSVLQTIVVVSLVVVLFLGLRTGLIVGAIVPATILLTLAVMNFVGIPLERMSLATLIIALGLLVDDGIIMAEDFKARLDEGESRDEAVRSTSSTLAIPSLTSSLTTILVFLPLMLADSDSGEYTRSISLVVLIALLISWALSLTFTTYFCHRFVKDEDDRRRGRFRRAVDAFFHRLRPLYESALRRTMRVRALFVGVMIGLFALGIWSLGLVPMKFFPDSDRAQVLVYLDLPAGSSMRGTTAVLEEIFTLLEDEERFPHIEHHAAYGGFGGPRFVLSLTPIDPEPSKAFFMIDVGERRHAQPTIDALRRMFAEDLPGVRGRVTKMFLGPSDSSLIEVQIKGPDGDFIHAEAQKIASLLRGLEGTYDVKTDWENRVTEIVVEVDQYRARRAGVSSRDIADALSSYFSGAVVSEFREGDDILPIVVRAQEGERDDLARVETVSVFSRSRGVSVPLMQVASVSHDTSFARIAREDLMRTVTVEAKNHVMSAEAMVPLLDPELAALRRDLPVPYEIEYDGVVGESAEARGSIMESLPLCIALMVFLVIAQFGSFRATSLIFLTVPLVIIGAALGLLVMGASFGFMVILGLYALAGIIINNAVILVDRIQIERDELEETGDEEEDRRRHFDAVISASGRRLRPILMSTTTTILGLMPLILSRDVLFYGQASAIAFGLAVGTVLTLGFVPVLYTFFFGIRPAART